MLLWFPVDPYGEMREEATPILEMLDTANIEYKWVGKGEIQHGVFKVAIECDVKDKHAIGVIYFIYFGRSLH